MTSSYHADIVRCKSYARSPCVFVRLIIARVELRDLTERASVCVCVFVYLCVGVGWGGDTRQSGLAHMFDRHTVQYVQCIWSATIVDNRRYAMIDDRSMEVDVRPSTVRALC